MPSDFHFNLRGVRPTLSRKNVVEVSRPMRGLHRRLCPGRLEAPHDPRYFKFVEQLRARHVRIAVRIACTCICIIAGRDDSPETRLSVPTLSLSLSPPSANRKLLPEYIIGRRHNSAAADRKRVRHTMHMASFWP
jgi:hypothetical protein